MIAPVGRPSSHSTRQLNSGSSVAAAKLELVQVETGIRAGAQTDDLGNYLYGRLRPGVYSLRVSSEGFQGVTLGDIRVQVAQRGRVDVRLTVGQVTETAGEQLRVQGNAASSSIEAPGINNWDIGALKNTRITERFNAQFRCETFNVFNHTQYGAPNLSLTSVNFGKITGTLIGPRRLQLGLKLIF